jgi:redox-sensitive bicupin YhaK (pirin superfamily)
VSGPLRVDDIAGDVAPPAPSTHVVEVTPSREALVGDSTVRRALPTRGRRTVGPWCFLDHAPEALVDARRAGMRVGPHPHIGLQTVTWLLDGEVVHRDSIGSEQSIRPGQLNLMSAGRGVVHAEETPASYRGRLHGVQLWVAQPERTRHGPPAFEHHGELPRVELDNAIATVIVGAFAGTPSPRDATRRPSASSWRCAPDVPSCPSRRHTSTPSSCSTEPSPSALPPSACPPSACPPSTGAS